MTGWKRFGILLTAAAFAAAVWMSLCVGRVDFGARVMLALCVLGLILWAAGLRNTKGRRVFCRLCAGGLALAAAAALGMSLWMNHTAAKAGVGDADVPWVVVFGAGVKGETPSLLLTLRTRAAYEYLREHPETKAVLTGGVGSDAAISEAEAMRRLLTAWGIGGDRLVCEDRARNTAENAAYSMPLMDDPEAVVSVSNAFHQYRCMQALTRAGARNVRTRSAPLPSVGVGVSMYLRECCAIVYHAVFG